jgi:hypothetical protein
MRETTHPNADEKTPEPIPSPYAPIEIPPEIFLEAEPRMVSPVRGNLAALAMTLLIVATGMYAAHKDIRASALTFASNTFRDASSAFANAGAARSTARDRKSRHNSGRSQLPLFHFSDEA